MHSYLVSLRISGKAFDPSDVTKDLSIEPTQVRIAGEPRPGGKSVWEESMWEYEARPTTGEIEWLTLEAGLRELLSSFSNCVEKLRVYQRLNEVCIFCGHFSDSFNGGPSLSPALLKSLGDFGVELFLDTYRANGVGAEAGEGS